MQELVQEIAELRNNVNQLVEMLGEVRKNEARLKHELAELREENKQQKDQIRFLKETNEMVNLAGSVDPSARAELKLKIKDLVREIDGCIAMIK